MESYREGTIRMASESNNFLLLLAMTGADEERGKQLDVLIPEVATSRRDVFIDRLKQELEQSSRSQLVRQVNLADLLEPEFMISYIRKGEI